MSDEEKDVAEAHGKLKRELARLHVASVKLQQWVVQNERSAPNTSRSTTPSGSFPKSSELLRECRHLAEPAGRTT
jgi:hypothetical protein